MDPQSRIVFRSIGENVIVHINTLLASAWTKVVLIVTLPTRLKSVGIKSSLR